MINGGVRFALIGLLFANCLWGDAGLERPIPERHFKFTYQVRIAGVNPETKTLEVWIPFPHNEAYQAVNNYQITSELEHTVWVDLTNGNKILYFSLTDEFIDKVNLEVIFDITRLENNSYVDGASVHVPAPPKELEHFLKASELVPIDGPIAKEALGVINAEMTTQEKIEALYKHLLRTISYDKSGDGWGKGDALFCSVTRGGNCTDIHSLFIGMARSLGIPARFVIGFPIPENRIEGAISGYHCWAEYYVEERGWVPVDISEAVRHPGKEGYYLGRIDENRVSFTTGRDIKIITSAGEQILNYFIYPLVLANGERIWDYDYSFRFAQVN